MNQEKQAFTLELDQFKQMVEYSPCGVIILEDDSIVYANDTFSRIVNLTPKVKLIEKSFINFLHPSYIKFFRNWLNKIHFSHQYSKSIELIMIKNNDTPFNVEIIGNRIYHRSKILIQLIINDITERKFIKTQIEYSAVSDSLSKLTDVICLDEHAQKLIKIAEANKTHLAVMYLDIDHFKFINERYGLKIANIVLETVFQRLKTVASPQDEILTLGGDKFAILMGNIKALGETNYLIKKYLNIFQQPFKVSDQEIALTTTAGISVFPENGLDCQTILKNADLAHYYAKKQGQNTFQFFTSSMSHHIKQHAELLFDLRHALLKNEFLVQYQPVVDVNTGEIIRMEALLRWHRQNEELLLPVDFLSLIEETGLIYSIGDWIINTVCQQNLAWQEAGAKHIPISINLSTVQFQAQSHLLSTIKTALSQTNLSTKYLGFEISENVSILNIGSGIIHQLKEMGINLTIDNFGASFFSLGELKRYQIDNIKIDRSLVAGISSNIDSISIVPAIIAMGKELGINVIAEGVETEEQLLFLKQHGCYQAQGNFICPPIDSDKVPEIKLSPLHFTKNV